jgi:hypothetical protein
MITYGEYIVYCSQLQLLKNRKPVFFTLVVYLHHTFSTLSRYFLDLLIAVLTEVNRELQQDASTFCIPGENPARNLITRACARFHGE